ncbi:MAG TPA: ABC transporter permease [Aggregatilinea sp.]|uniref:ABC transporter permease n=1 Tax=Aggregatilinea sp. TaxID=2806333 RepID=UPI002C99B0A9|nr:ABC transporter permease [Aggregatilinea sp.]HML21346.1 ABC transporter permease [Aggregatilinea sp.]
MVNTRARYFFARNTYLFSLLLLAILLSVNYSLQDNLFELRILNNSMRTLLPLIVLAVGQSVVIIGGGIDLSVGTMVSMLVAVLVKLIDAESSSTDIVLAVLAACGVGALAGTLNGVMVAVLRLQPIVTTYATSFIFSGVALVLLPRPGGQIPTELRRFYAGTPNGIPLAFYVIGILILVWMLLRSTRYAQFLFATGSNDKAAYTTGVPVKIIRLTTYIWAGVFAGLAASALTFSTGSGQANIGDNMTLDSIVAVVLGGTRLSGGKGGIAGAIIGVMILRVIRNVIFFADVPTWSQTLVNALIIIAALAGPGLVGLIRRVVNK